MAKCYLCGKEHEKVITISGYNHSEVICGACALKYGIISDPDFVALIRKAEEKQEEPKRRCSNCKHIARKCPSTHFRYCKRYKLCFRDSEIDYSFCECHELKQ